MIKTCSTLVYLILFMASYALAHTQDLRIPAPVSVIIDSYKSIQELPQPEWIIKEGDTPLTIQDMLDGDIKDGEVLKINPDEIIIEQFEKYWFAIEFNSKVDLHNWLLHIENNSYSGFGWNNNFSEIKSYGVQDGRILSSGITGYFVPESKRDYKKRHTQSLLNLNLSSESTLTLWVHIRKNYFINSAFPQLTIYDPAVAFPDIKFAVDALFWFGTFFIIWILSLIIYIYLRDRTSIWFFIFITILILDTLSNMSSDPLTRIFYPENPGIGVIVGWGTSVFMMVFLLQFARVFINLPLINRKLDKVIYLSIWVFFIASIALFYLFFHHENLAFITILMFIYGITYLGSGTIYLFLKDSLSRIIGLALLLFVIPNLIPLPIGENFISISALLLTVTIGVGYRLKNLFEERLKAEKEMKDFLTQQNTLLENQVAERTAELSHSLSDLKSTQAQLIQQEKLASLGQLTAGIAHEIQNPLNFVNNFSEVSSELLDEMNEELDKGDIEEAKVISKDIKQNLEKINHHGKRADAIVKGMLEHSRTSSGEKVPTDLNALADEYLRLSYHGLRAKDKSFNADFKTDFDPDLPSVNVVSQDIGRVLLNIITNAFQALNNDELKIKNEEFKPLVTVSTKNLGDKIEISVRDNGPGIPDAIKDKIFQPFFTTKPTGQGTGLGLSLSYDIVKAHGGELKMESIERKGTEFIIQLPIV
jgi:signal transduction histidine kinase